MLPRNPPLSPGVLVDVTQNYGSAFYSCAVGMAVSALFLGLVKPAKRGLLCRRRNSKHPEDVPNRKRDSEEQGAARKPDKRTDSPQNCCEVDENIIHNQAEATRDVQEVIRFA